MSEPNEVLKTIGVRVQAHASAKNGGEFAIDPMTVLAIINIMMTVAKFIYACRKDQDSISRQMKKPSLFYKLIIRREIGKEWKDKKQRKVMYSAFLEVGSGLSEKEISTLVKEVEKLK
jgi:hypothetical protein